MTISNTYVFCLQVSCSCSTFSSTFETVGTASLPRMTRIIFSWTSCSTAFSAVLNNSTRSKSTRPEMSSKHVLRIIQCVHRLCSAEMKRKTCGIVTCTSTETLFPMSEETSQALYGVRLVGLVSFIRHTDCSLGRACSVAGHDYDADGNWSGSPSKR